MRQIESIEKFRTHILEELCENYLGNRTAAKVETAEEAGTPTDILTMMQEDVGDYHANILGQMYYMPTSGIGYDIFQILYILDEDGKEQYISVLEKAANALNYYFPTGAVIANQNQNMVMLKQSIVIPRELEEEDVLRLIEMNARCGLQFIEPYVGSILKMGRGLMEWEEFQAQLPNA